MRSSLALLAISIWSRRQPVRVVAQTVRSSSSTRALSSDFFLRHAAGRQARHQARLQPSSDAVAGQVVWSSSSCPSGSSSHRVVGPGQPGPGQARPGQGQRRPGPGLPVWLSGPGSSPSGSVVCHLQASRARQVGPGSGSSFGPGFQPVGPAIGSGPGSGPPGPSSSGRQARPAVSQVRPGVCRQPGTRCSFVRVVRSGSSGSSGRRARHRQGRHLSGHQPGTAVGQGAPRRPGQVRVVRSGLPAPTVPGICFFAHSAPFLAARHFIFLSSCHSLQIFYLYSRPIC